MPYAQMIAQMPNYDEHWQALRIKDTEKCTVYVIPLIYTWAIIVTEPDDKVGYYDRWCYEHLAIAITAATEWDPDTQPEPAGWHRHPSSGRRRPNGNAAEEYVNR